jgi:DNA-directed RNA polymerase subunit alpha
MSDAKLSSVQKIIQDPSAGRLEFLEARALAYTTRHGLDEIGALVAEAREQSKGSHSEEAKTQAGIAAGIGLWILGKYAEAAEALEPISDHKDAAYFRGLCLLRAKAYADATASFQKAAKAGQDAFACAIGEVEALRLSGKRDEALARIRELRKGHAGEAELHFQSGRCMEDALEIEPAIEEFERALELDPDHVEALFRLGYCYDLRGSDDRALQCYEKAAAIPPARPNVLLNLGLMYEDRGEYERASALFERVAAADPMNECARMFVKDVISSLDMYYDEATERKQHRTAALLRIPLSEFELSSRCRACLDKMSVRTLGDLARLSEEDISGSRNFGETSLTELRNLLESKGLHFGIGRSASSRPLTPLLTPQEGSVLLKPMSDLDLSVRSLKCVRSLGCETVGDLAGKTEKELLKCANFGQTSLMEIKNKLANLGLSLKTRE